MKNEDGIRINKQEIVINFYSFYCVLRYIVVVYILSIVISYSLIKIYRRTCPVNLPLSPFYNFINFFLIIQ